MKGGRRHGNGFSFISLVGWRRDVLFIFQPAFYGRPIEVKRREKGVQMTWLLLCIRKSYKFSLLSFFSGVVWVSPTRLCTVAFHWLQNWPLFKRSIHQIFIITYRISKKMRNGALFHFSTNSFPNCSNRIQFYVHYANQLSINDKLRNGYLRN